MNEWIGKKMRWKKSETETDEMKGENEKKTEWKSKMGKKCKNKVKKMEK